MTRGQVVGQAGRRRPPAPRRLDREDLDGDAVLAGDGGRTDVETVEGQHAGHLGQQSRVGPPPPR